MEVLKVRHILDNILSNLRNWWNKHDYLNLISALHLTNEYAHRELWLKKSDSISMALLTQNLKYFTSETIRSHFDLFWNNVDLSEFNENFFIDNQDLIDQTKLKQLKKKNNSNNRNFSGVFYQTFSTYNSLKICSNMSWYNECLNEVEIMNQLCDTCNANKCPRCEYVILSKLELDNWGCCERCAEC